MICDLVNISFYVIRVTRLETFNKAKSSDDLFSSLRWYLSLSLSLFLPLLTPLMCHQVKKLLALFPKINCWLFGRRPSSNRSCPLIVSSRVFCNVLNGRSRSVGQQP